MCVVCNGLACVNYTAANNRIEVIMKRDASTLQWMKNAIISAYMCPIMFQLIVIQRIKHSAKVDELRPF